MTPHRILHLLAALAVGVTVGALGTFGHRSLVPWGLVLGIVASVAAAVWLRATFGPVPVMAYVVGWVVAVQVLAGGGPGGDTQVVADTTGYVWVYGTVLLVIATLWLPRTWFADVEARWPGARREVPAAADGQNVG